MAGMTRDTVGLGIIGAGIMGERMLRAATGHAAESVHVTGVWDPSQAALARVAELAPAAPSMEALIEGADCVYIASPPASHLALAEAALAAGKAVFLEKPLAADVIAAGRFVAAHKADRIAVNFPMATSFAVERLKGWLAELGAARKVAIEVGFANWPRGWQRDAAGWLDGRAEGGFTREVVSHFLFLTQRLCGGLQLEEGHAVFPPDGRSERAIVARLRAGTVPVTLQGGVGTTEKDDHNSWTLGAEGGSVRLRDWAFAERLVDAAWVGDPDALPNEKTRPLVLRRQLAAVAAMTRGGSHPLATIVEAYGVQRAVEGILLG